MHRLFILEVLTENIGATKKECVRLIEICKEENVIFMCGYPVRYREGLIKLKEMLDSGKYGKPLTNARVALQSFRVVWVLYDAEKRGVVADLRGLGLEDAYK